MLLLKRGPSLVACIGTTHSVNAKVRTLCGYDLIRKTEIGRVSVKREKRGESFHSKYDKKECDSNTHDMVHMEEVVDCRLQEQVSSRRDPRSSVFGAR